MTCPDGLWSCRRVGCCRLLVVPASCLSMSCHRLRRSTLSHKGKKKLNCFVCGYRSGRRTQNMPIFLKGGKITFLIPFCTSSVDVLFLGRNIHDGNVGAGQNIPGQNIPCHFFTPRTKHPTKICHPGQNIRGGRSSMGCFVRGCKNGMGCFVRGDKNCMGCFVRGGKLMRDVLSGVAKNGMGCFVPGCFVLHSGNVHDQKRPIPKRPRPKCPSFEKMCH